MIPPKYNFYIGKKNNQYLSMDIDLYINPSTGEYVENKGMLASRYKANIPTGITHLFVNKEAKYPYAYIYFYDKDDNYLGSHSIKTNGQIVPIKKNAYTFTISYSSLDTGFYGYTKDGSYIDFIYALKSVNPHYKDLSKKYAKESGQEFFRISLDGKINLFGDDYEQVSLADIESQLLFIIEKYSSSSKSWYLYYKGEFSKTDCKFDHSKKKCELKTTAIDNYNEIMNKYDNTYDLIKLAPEISRINLHKRSLMQVYVRGANSITNFFGGTYWEDDVNEAIDNHNDLINKYYFSYIKAGNEFYVKGAGISEVNGVYAGTNGYWSQWNGYTCYMGTETPGVNAYIYIKRNSDDTILYRSEKQYVFLEQGNCYIGREDIVMVNVNNSSDKFTIESPFVYHIYRRLLCDIDSVTDSEGTKNTYDLPSDDFVTDNRNYKKCIGLTGGLFFCTSRAVDEPTKYGLNDYGKYFTNHFIPSSSGLGRPLPISKNSWANASLWYVYDSYYEYFEEKLRKMYMLKDSYSIGAAIKAILKKINPQLTHEPTAEYSQFLYGDTNPLGLARFYVYITQKTNILKGNYDQPAQKAETSLEELMKMLRDCFRCYWYIEDNKLKIEHIHFFMNGGSYSNDAAEQLDFTNLYDQFNKKLSSYFQSEVEFDKSELNQRYEFGWMDDVTDLFGGVTIDVKSNYIQKDKTEEINIGQFSSDIDFMLFNPSNFSDDGFALLCPLKNMAVKLYDYKNGYILGSSTKLPISSSSTTSFVLNEYKVEAGVNYRLKGRTGGSITAAALFEDAQMTKLITSWYSYTSYDTHDINAVLTMPRSGYLAITVLTTISEQERLNLGYEGLTLPIIKAYNLIDENGDTYDAIAQNWYASWIYLQNLYLWDMPASNIESNVIGDIYAHDIKKCMKHTIEFPSEEDLDTLKLINTEFGNGKIDEMSFNINNRQAKVNLLYRPR